MPQEIAMGTVRLSTGVLLTEEDVDNAIKIISEAVGRLLSSSGDEEDEPIDARPFFDAEAQQEREEDHGCRHTVADGSRLRSRQQSQEPFHGMQTQDRMPRSRSSALRCRKSLIRGIALQQGILYSRGSEGFAERPDVRRTRQSIKVAAPAARGAYECLHQQ